MSTPFARIDRARGLIVLTRGAWSIDMRPADLPRWLAFYEEMASRSRGRYARIYDPDVAELRRVQKALEARPMEPQAVRS